VALQRLGLAVHRFATARASSLVAYLSWPGLIRLAKD